MMYYVIQTASNRESDVENYIDSLLDKRIYDRYFHPVRAVQKKIRGQWVTRYKKLFPGYVFLITDDIESLYEELKKVPTFTKVLGREGERFFPLSENEVEWLKKLMNISENTLPDRFEAVVAISNIGFDENDRVVVKDGPLKNLSGCIKKINLHKKIAEVELDFMNKKTTIYLGLEYVRKSP